MFAVSKYYNKCYIGFNGKKHNDLPSVIEILSQLNFIIGIFILEPN